MSREVRKVPSWWQHPKTANGQFRPIFDGDYLTAAREFADGKAAWKRGEFPAGASDENTKLTWDEYHGKQPDHCYYMPQFRDDERTHFMMYEAVSDGTPISPSFATAEELARWLTDNRASAGAYSTATYEQWLRVCNGGYAPSMVIINGVPMSGVEGLALIPDGAP